MKKKLFSIILCLLLCVAPCFMLSGCGEAKLTAEEAQEMMITAITNMQAKTTYELNMSMGLMGSAKVIVTEDAQYSKMDMFGMNAEVWVETEGSVAYDYTITSMVMGDEEVLMYSKSVSEGLVASMDDIDLDMGDSTFVSATLKKGVATIVYSTEEDGATVKVTYVIENDLIVSVTMVDAEGVTVSAATIKYDSAVVVPVRPTEDAEGQPIVWVEDME